MTTPRIVFVIGRWEGKHLVAKLGENNPNTVIPDGGFFATRPCAQIQSGTAVIGTVGFKFRGIGDDKFGKMAQPRRGLMTMGVQMLFDRDYAAMRHFADRMFELNCGVDDLELFMQARSNVLQNSLANRWRDICNRNMCGERMSL